MKRWGIGFLFFAIAISILGSARAFSHSLSEAQALERRQDWDGLVKYGRAWTQAEPNNANAWGILSVAYFFGLHRPDLALEPTKRAVALAPKNPSAWTALGNIDLKLKRYPEAVDAFNHAVQLAPRNGNHWNNLATAYSYESNYPMALQALEQQEKVAGPDQDYTLWYNLGNGFLNVFYSGQNGAPTGREGAEILRRAEHAYQQTLRLNPRYANAWNNLGTVEQALGASQDALNDYQRAASLGDSVGRSNYTQLQNAIAAAKRQAAGSVACGPITTYKPGCPFVPGWVVAHDAAVFNWNHSYHAPGDIRGRPW
jgi:tetratricopeptide (TPR) repeat protein